MRTLLPLVLVFLAVVSCGRPRATRRAENEILFTITQTSTSTEARYQFLRLDHEGQITEGVDESLDGECYYEPLEERLGTLNVEDGTATWKTALLPDDGLVLRANAEAARVDRRAWQTDDLLSFDARGFAMPEPKPLVFDAPPADLEVIAPLAGDVQVRDELEVMWRPPVKRTLARVVVQLDSESDDRIICFFGAAAGRGSIPGALIDVLRARSESKAGTLQIGTHRQVSIPGPGSWFIYVVANSVARTQSFSLN